jgi:hypothetical protein
MAADVTIVDNAAHSITVNCTSWSYNLTRFPKEFLLSSLPSLGAKGSLAVDFGSYTEYFNIVGNVGSRSIANNVEKYSYDDWFANSPMTITIPALDSTDQATTIAETSGTEAVLTHSNVHCDASSDGPEIYRVELTFNILLRVI